MDRRWDVDERGQGVAGGGALVEGARELLDAMGAENWVAEDPEAHLLPHLERACADGRLGLELLGARFEDAAEFEVELSWTGDPRDSRAARAAVFALVGSIAESATYVRQRRDSGGDVDAGRPGEELRFEVATGMLAPDTEFATHGHVLILRLRSADD